MRGRIGLFAIAVAAAALVACENESFAGRRHRGCSSCGSCGTACATCTVPEAEAAAAAPQAEDAQAVAKAAETEPAPAAVVEQPSTRGTYYVSRRGWRRGRR